MDFDFEGIWKMARLSLIVGERTLLAGIKESLQGGSVSYIRGDGVYCIYD